MEFSLGCLREWNAVRGRAEELLSAWGLRTQLGCRYVYAGLGLSDDVFYHPVLSDSYAGRAGEVQHHSEVIVHFAIGYLQFLVPVPQGGDYRFCVLLAAAGDQ